METAAHRFAVNPPVTKEGYYYRSLFEHHFPGDAAARCVLSEPSIACSSATALKWDAEFTASADPSGRAIKGIHNDAF
jgi:asparagine synthase (glutamine-hydrolysing)